MIHIRWDFEDLPDLANLKRDLQRPSLLVIGQTLDFSVNDRNMTGLDRENAMGAILDFLLAGATKNHARQDTVHTFGIAIASSLYTRQHAPLALAPFESDTLSSPVWRYSLPSSTKPSNIAMPIKLDWRFDSLQHLAEVHMKELWDFYSQAEKQFQVAMKNWEKETEGLTEEAEAMYSDSLIDERNKIESLLDRGHTLGISAVYTFLERFLNLIVEYLRAGGAPITESIQGFSLQKIRDLLLEHTKLNIGRPPFDWKRLDQLREIRNCIVHTDGWITEDFKERLGEVGLTVKEDTRLVLPPKYFQKCWRLVNETWEFVYSHCSKEFGYRKQHELWLRPASTFTSDKLREILREAIAAGIAARKKAERKSEGSCGWVWLEIDRKLLKHIHKLQIPNISTSYNTTARVENFHLYLNEVENHMHMGATIRGIEAAATVLENYGINSNVRSLAD